MDTSVFRAENGCYVMENDKKNLLFGSLVERGPLVCCLPEVKTWESLPSCGGLLMCSWK